MDGTTWSPVGTKDASTGVYGANVSYKNNLYIRFNRIRTYKFTYNTNYPGTAMFTDNTASTHYTVTDHRFQQEHILY